MTDPKVTFLLVCYNHQDYVAESINSVLQQTYPNVELVVVDDHSSDRSHEIISGLHAQHPFTYIRHEQNLGLNNAILSGLNAATGDYISFLASDDFATPDKAAVQMEFLQKTGKLGVYSTGYAYRDGHKELIRVNDVFKTGSREQALEYIYQHDWGVPLQQSSLLSRVIMFGLTDLRKQFKSDDWAFIIRVYENYDVAYLDHPVFYYRLHDTNTHKKYWFTFPMRVDIASRLTPERYRLVTLSNIFQSQAQYLLWDKKKGAIRFYLCSLILNFSFKNVRQIAYSFGAYVKNRLTAKPAKS